MNRQPIEASNSAGEESQCAPTIPDEMRAVVLDGTGFSHLGVRKVPTPRPGPQQMLARVDAAGICTSLIKLIEQGPNHPLIFGWDVTRFPLILGDEGSVTLVEVGADLRARYRPGQRYVIQPAVDSAPINHRERYRDHARGVNKVAVGYTLGGHLAEYVLISEEILAAGCLLPLPDATLPYAHAALSEPFSCVISAQDHHVHLTQENPLGPRGVAERIEAWWRDRGFGGGRYGTYARCLGHELSAPRDCGRGLGGIAPGGGEDALRPPRRGTGHRAAHAQPLAARI